MTAKFLPVVLAWLLASAAADARDWHVNHETGKDSQAGTSDEPLNSIALAIKNAQPGDTIHLAKTKSPYPAGVTFHNKSGKPGKPITLDGHGATLSGAAPIVPRDWQRIQPGLSANSTLLNRPDRAVIDRFFFIIDGKMNRMGRSLKGPKEAWKEPEELRPGEWCWFEEEKAFYLKTAQGHLVGADIKVPLTSNGVAISGDCNHLVIRNLTATHVYNDGFNIHGRTRKVRFEDIRAIECGDDGVSAHGDCRIVIDGLVSIGNSTGVCHVNASHSAGSRHFIQGCHGYAYFVLDEGVHTLRDSVIICDAAQSVVVNGPREENGMVCRLAMENVLITGEAGTDILKANRRSEVDFRQVSIFNLPISAAGQSFRIHDSVIGGEPKPHVVVYPETTWKAGGNLFDLEYLRIGPNFFKADAFETYRKQTGQGMQSRWGSLDIERSDLEAGVDFTRLPEENLTESP